jgi:hypothetical protein
MKIKTEDKSTLEVITTDSYTGEGTDYLTIDIYNNLCKDSAHIGLEKEEVIKLRDELNEWLNE